MIKNSCKPKLVIVELQPMLCTLPSDQIEIPRMMGNMSIYLSESRRSKEKDRLLSQIVEQALLHTPESSIVWFRGPIAFLSWGRTAEHNRSTYAHMYVSIEGRCWLDAKMAVIWSIGRYRPTFFAWVLGRWYDWTLPFGQSRFSRFKGRRLK